MDEFSFMLRGPLPILVTLGLGVVLLVRMIDWTLGPLLRFAPDSVVPARFMLTDLIWLLVQLQLVLGLLVRVFDASMPTFPRMTILILMSLPVLALWGVGVNLVSRAGIRELLPRASVIVLVLPGTLLAILGIPLLLLAELSLLGETRLYRNNGQELAWNSCLLVLVVAMPFALRMLATWAMTRSQRARPGL